jgi:hypothetical protein
MPSSFTNFQNVSWLEYFPGISVIMAKKCLYFKSNFGYNSPRLAASKSTEQKVLIPHSLLRGDSLIIHFLKERQGVYWELFLFSNIATVVFMNDILESIRQDYLIAGSMLFLSFHPIYWRFCNR